MKSLLVLQLCVLIRVAFGQVSTEFDGNNWKAPYELNAPQDWGIERFLIPIEFAPQIPYKGVEDVRFTPGWGKPTSDEYWSYAFLWYLDGSPTTNEKIIEGNLNSYYTGLIGRNITRRKIPAEKIFPVNASIKEVITENGDRKTYRGTIEMLDYMEQKPIVLNCVVHLKSCSEQNRTFILHEISPKPLKDNVWRNLERLSEDFKCIATVKLK
jgi:hypothetical protein